MSIEREVGNHSAHACASHLVQNLSPRIFVKPNNTQDNLVRQMMSVFYASDIQQLPCALRNALLRVVNSEHQRVKEASYKPAVELNTCVSIKVATSIRRSRTCFDQF